MKKDTPNTRALRTLWQGGVAAAIVAMLGVVLEALSGWEVADYTSAAAWTGLVVLALQAGFTAALSWLQKHEDDKKVVDVQALKEELNARYGRYPGGQEFLDDQTPDHASGEPDLCRDLNCVEFVTVHAHGPQCSLGCECEGGGDEYDPEARAY